MTMTDPTMTDWGPWHGHVAEGLDSCADYLDRCRRSVEGDIAPDRHYFAEKARALRDASVSLVGRCAEVERWLGECGTDYQASDGEGDVVIRSCTRAAGHAGDHDDRPSPGARASERAQDLAAVAVEAADVLAWATTAGAGGQDRRAALSATADQLHSVADQAASLAAAVIALATGSRD